MTIKHAKTSTAGPSSDPAKLGGDDWNNDHVIDQDGLVFPSGTATPTAPAAGNVRVVGRTIAGRSMLAGVGSDGLVSTLQAHLGRNKVAFWLPGGNGTTLTAVGLPPPNSAGTARNVTTTNLFQSMRRVGFVTAATASNNTNIRASNAAQFFLGAAAGMGGFHYVCRFGTSNAAVITDGRVFIGLSVSTTSLGGVNPSTMLNLIGIGYDGGDVNWSIINNDGVGTATKTDLGANFPCTTQSVDVYEFAMYVPPNSVTVKWAVTRLNTGDYVAGAMSSDIPAANALMQPHFNVTNGASALSVGLDLMSLYIETDS